MKTYPVTSESFSISSLSARGGDEGERQTCYLEQTIAGNVAEILEA